MDRASPFLALAAALTLGGPVPAQPPAGGYPELAKLRQLIGKDHLSPEMLAARKVLGNNPEAVYYDDSFYHLWKARGIEFRYSSANAVTAIHFFSEGADGYKPYTGTL